MNIVKASAGSGKTFSLAGKYLTLLFSRQDRYAYRHILAVTFTNKATDEMKTRIMKELFVLATDPGHSDYIGYFIPGYGSGSDDVDPKDIIRELPGKPGRKITLESLADSAMDMLCNMLHDYSAFAVSTIDRFFQQTLRAFSREIGQFSSYQVELDKDSLVAESVDRVLDALTEEDSILLGWLTDSVMEQIEQGGRYNLERSLVTIARRLKSDEHRSLVEKFGIDEGKVYSRENLSSIRAACGRTIRDFEDSVKDSAKALLDMLDSAGVSPSDFNRGFMKALLYYAEPGHGDVIEPPSASFMTKARDHGQWFAKSKEKTFKSAVWPLIESPLEDFCNLFGKDYSIYRTALILKGQLYGLGVSADLYREFNALMKEKNVLSIDDSNTILKDIIDGSDAPFVYEKTGVRYDNFLLDEFQDTSRIQWENFRPLLQNSESQGFDNLIVGDVKQSIYRWRGSDWNLLDTEVRTEFIEAAEKTLDTNYRSCRNIIAFNNAFFPVAASILDRQYGEQSGRSISDIYSDVRQKMPLKPKGEGEIRMMFCDRELEAEKVLSTVNMLRERGVEYGEMAVLVRNNVSGAEIAAYLIDNDVPVLTDDSLKVKSSATVRRLVSLLSYADNPADAVNGFLARSLDISVPGNCHSLPDLCEALLRGLREADQEVFDGEVLYIQSFMDAVQDYVAVNGNSLHEFLLHWAESDPAISSPSSGDSLRIMTIHKSKGLAFRYVIFPYVETVTLFKPDSRWCRPDLSGTSLDDAADGLYDVKLSSKSDMTLFSGDYRKELKMQYVDNINTVYVAFTRAVKGMYLIAEAPSDKFIGSLDAGGDVVFSDFSQILYKFAESVSGRSGEIPPAFDADGQKSPDTDMMPDLPRFEYGKEEDGTSVYYAGSISCGMDKPSNERNVVMKVGAGYPSWPLNPLPDEGGETVAGERGRLKFSTDSADFFSEEGLAGTEASGRLKGIVLHDILSRVESPDDLSDAVRLSVMSGELDEAGGREAFALLSERIASVEGRGWFMSAVADVARTDVSGDAGAACGGDRDAAPLPVRIRREVSLIDTDGSIVRPDRVIEYGDGSILVIDYKFGHREPAAERKYRRQVARYADIWRRTGHVNVSAVLWYVADGEIIEVV